MNIRIRENINNKLNDIEKKIDIELVDGQISDDIVWTFLTTSSPDDSGILMHSSDSDEGTYLSYANMTNPEMTIKLPEAGVYKVKVLAELVNNEEGTYTTSTLDSDGNLIETVHDGIIPTKSYAESSELLLVYKTENNEWV